VVINEPQNWGPPYWDEEHAAYASDLLNAADALLLGRKTYEAFADAWPTRSGDRYADQINAMPKYVASRTLENPTWNATVLEGDVPEAVAALKAEDGTNLLKYGTGSFSKTLLEHKLVDEYHFWIFPVLVGSGDRLFEGVQASLDLVDTTRFGSGIVVHRYTPK
jgi:dihydrofolate reductase